MVIHGCARKARCDTHGDHGPHPYGGTYETVRYGVVPRWCLGSGALSGRLIRRGSADSLDVFETTPGSADARHGALVAERDELVARLAEIDAEIGG